MTMKAIINGTRYDTEKATFIAEMDNLGSGAESVTDYAYWTAGLYRTPRSGRYFLAGKGGPMSQFAERVGRSGWTGGERIIPFEDEAAALAWAEDAVSGASVFVTGSVAGEILDNERMRAQPTEQFRVDGADAIEHFFSHLIEDA